jgi:hypothetical protein
MRLKLTKHISRNKKTNAEKYNYMQINTGSYSTAAEAGSTVKIFTFQKFMYWK